MPMPLNHVPQATAIYARISDDPEGREAGVTRQIEDATAKALANGWGLSPRPPFVDNDISASTLSKAKRPAFELMLSLIEQGEIDAVVVYTNGRLTRRPMENEALIQLHERTGVQFDSVRSGRSDLSTADGRMIARMLAAQDAAEAERISERVKRAFVQRREQGKPNPSSRAFGFEKGGMVVREEEAALLREAARRIIDDGWSLGQVVTDWNERGIPTVRGAGRWHRITVSRALLNPRTAGMVSQGGEVLRRGAFDAILTAEEQKQIKKALEGNRNGNTVSYKQRKHVLAGFLVCGRCDRPMKINGLLDERGEYRKDSFVWCAPSQYGCGKVKRNLRHLTEYVDSIVKVAIEGEEPTGEADLTDEMAAKADELRERLAEIDDDIADLKRQFNAGQVRLRDYSPDLAALRNLQEVTEQALRNLSVATEVDPDLDLLEGWVKGTVDEQRLVLERFVDHIKLHPIGKVGPKRAHEMIPATTEIVPRTRG